MNFSGSNLQSMLAILTTDRHSTITRFFHTPICPWMTCRKSLAFELWQYLRDLDIKHIENVAKVLKTTKPKTRSYVAVRQNRIDDEFYEDDEFLSTSYRREILTVACMITKWGFERSYVSENPFKEYQLPERPPQPYDYWRLNEEDKFLTWLEDGGYVTKRVCKPFSISTRARRKDTKK